MLDLFTTLEFDFNIAYFQRQPVEVGYLDSRGTQKSFCPEFLITYRQDITPAKSMKPLLCDVLTRTDIIHYWPDFKNRVRSANKYAQARKWTYRVLTEREIRTPFLQNAQLLLPYRSLRAPAGVGPVLLDGLQRLGRVKVKTLLDNCSLSGIDLATLGTVLYRLIALGWIETNLRQPFSMQSDVWFD